MGGTADENTEPPGAVKSAWNLHVFHKQTGPLHSYGKRHGLMTSSSGISATQFLDSITWTNNIMV